MSSAALPRPAGVAAFDFDGTLTPGDTFAGFLRRACGSRAVATALARSVGAVGRRAGPAAGGRDAVKAALVLRLLAGRDAAELAALGQEYGVAVARMVTPRMRQLIGHHAAARHAVVIVSASLELYVGPAGARIGADRSLATRLEVGGDGLLTGRLEGPNCRGAEKGRRLKDWMAAAGLEGGPGAPVPVWAYGDSAGDRELLALADVAVRVRRGHPRGQTPDAVRASNLS